MRQFHARTHFARVAVIDMRRQQMLEDYRARFVGGTGTVYRSARYRRLCRAAAMYRVAGFLSPQEI